MKQKYIPVPCHYVLANISLEEIAAAFYHNLRESKEGKIPESLNEKEWTTISLCSNDAVLLANIVNGFKVRIVNKFDNLDSHILQIHISETLKEDEIYFS